MSATSVAATQSRRNTRQGGERRFELWHRAEVRSSRDGQHQAVWPVALPGSPRTQYDRCRPHAKPLTLVVALMTEAPACSLSGLRRFGWFVLNKKRCIYTDKARPVRDRVQDPFLARTELRNAPREVGSREHEVYEKLFSFWCVWDPCCVLVFLDTANERVQRSSWEICSSSRVRKHPRDRSVFVGYGKSTSLRHTHTYSRGDVDAKTLRWVGRTKTTTEVTPFTIRRTGPVRTECSVQVLPDRSSTLKSVKDDQLLLHVRRGVDVEARLDKIQERVQYFALCVVPGSSRAKRHLRRRGTFDFGIDETCQELRNTQAEHTISADVDVGFVLEIVVVLVAVGEPGSLNLSHGYHQKRRTPSKLAGSNAWPWWGCCGDQAGDRSPRVGHHA